jgi:hypothetical protein
MIIFAVCSNAFGCVDATAFLGPGGIIGTPVVVPLICVLFSIAFNRGDQVSVRIASVLALLSVFSIPQNPPQYPVLAVHVPERIRLAYFETFNILTPAFDC